LNLIPPDPQDSLKRCPRCKIDKPSSSFRYRSSAGSRRTSYCRPCERSYNRDYYRVRDAQKQNVRVAKNAVLYRQRNRMRILEYLFTHPCVDCGESDPIVLEFDHVLGQKQGNMSTMVHGDTNWSKIATEIAKCEIRCANCHRQRTFRQFNYSSWPKP
jgi:hypothetical protein